MPERLTSALYGRETVNVIAEAFGIATAEFPLARREVKILLLGGIIDAVDAGEHEPSVLADGVSAALRNAIGGGLFSE
jgi:hypothetical protein